VVPHDQADGLNLHLNTPLLWTRQPFKEHQMLKKNYTSTGQKCRVTFKYPNPEQADSAVLAGDFNDWSLSATPMKQLKDGSFSVTVSLPAHCSYQFRYVLDGNIWLNEPEADGYVTNEFGEDNSVIRV